MSERRRPLAELMYSALNNRDLETFLARVHPEVEFRSLVAESEGETFRGHDGVRRWWTQVAEALGGLRFELQEYTELRDAVVTRVRVRGTAGSVPVEQTMWQAVLFDEEDRAVWWQTCRSEEEARTTLGERERAR